MVEKILQPIQTVGTAAISVLTNPEKFVPAGVDWRKDHLKVSKGNLLHASEASTLTILNDDPIQSSRNYARSCTKTQGISPNSLMAASTLSSPSPPSNILAHSRAAITTKQQQRACGSRCALDSLEIHLKIGLQWALTGLFRLVW